MKAASVVSKILQRSFQSLYKNQTIKSYSTKFTTREFEEIQFSVPWGHIAGKWYGPKDKRPIVGVHGWQDNAGTFDTLAPLLPHDIGFLAIDLPGHGLSSWLPAGCGYHSIEYVKVLLSLMREFKWDRISMICHSLSAINGIIFTASFPDKCDMFVSLDVQNPIWNVKEAGFDALANKFVEHDKQIDFIFKKAKPPCYEMDDLVERTYKGLGKSISKECCPFILQRNIRASDEEENKYYFGRDGRLKGMIFNIPHHDDFMEIARRIRCPHLYIEAQKNPQYKKDPKFEEIAKTFKLNPKYEYHLVEGTHYVHLNEAQKIASIVNPFIKKYKP